MNQKTLLSCWYISKAASKKYSLKVLLLLFMLPFYFLTINAQEGINSTGGNSSGEGGSISYSVGQLVYTTNLGTNGSVAQGVQQPFEISVVIGIEELTGISLQCSAYPNPASDYLILKIENTDIMNLSYKLFDVSGKLLANKNIESSETRITMSSLIPATYFLKITQNNQEVKTFKIIKN